MTWSANYETKGDDVTLVGVVSDEASASLDKALSAVGEIIKSEVLGSYEKNYKVAIVGHSNPNNEPVAGWSNDSLTINIYQMEEAV